MSLAAFITSELDAIIAEWERFAMTLLPSAATMTSLALRDHARQILEAIAREMVEPQTAAQSGDKSKGKEDNEADVNTAAAVHGALRHTAGFDLRQLFAEYRALRASVLRLWSEHAGDPQGDALYQMTRFNEAIDQALAESVARFSDDVDRSRDTFIAVLGDDLRAPLQVIAASASSLSTPHVPATVQVAAIASISTSVRDIGRTVSDLLEYTRTRLGKAIPINARSANVETVVRESLAEVGAGHPQRSFRVETGEDLVAVVDSTRLQQAVSNLLSNAIEHGSPGGSVELIARKDAESVVIDVSNEGATIPPEMLQVIFDPLVQVAAGKGTEKRLGLGLFVAREIALGHGGTIAARSADRRTTFTLRVPLNQA
jgi:Osmosensitive K+ channel histidine kinase